MGAGGHLLRHAAGRARVVGRSVLPRAARHLAGGRAGRGLARELGICLGAIAVVTDYDAGIDGVAPVSYDEVTRVFEANIERLRAILARAIAAVPAERSCTCKDATGGVSPTVPGA